MFNLLKSSNSLVVAENVQSYLDQRTPNITLFSQDGYKIRIHKVSMYVPGTYNVKLFFTNLRMGLVSRNTSDLKYQRNNFDIFLHFSGNIYSDRIHA